MNRAGDKAHPAKQFKTAESAEFDKGNQRASIPISVQGNNEPARPRAY